MIENIKNIEAVIVSFNDSEYLNDCLEALFPVRGRIETLHIVHNSPMSKSVNLDRLPIKILHHNPDRNLGFGSAVNLAVKSMKPKTEFILTINPDCMLNEDWVVPAITHMEKDKSVASVGCDLFYLKDGKRIIDGLGDVLTIWGLGRRVGHGLPFSIARYLRTKKIDSVCAALAIYRRSSFEEAGGFDPEYFLYLEDLDLGLRLSQLGYKNAQISGFPSIHIGSQSSGGRCSSVAAYYGQRNRFLLLAKSARASKLLLLISTWWVGDLILMAKAAHCRNLLVYFKGTLSGWVLFAGKLSGRRSGGG